jgi:hypothetical protein
MFLYISFYLFIISNVFFQKKDTSLDASLRCIVRVNKKKLVDYYLKNAKLILTNKTYIFG